MAVCLTEKNCFSYPHAPASSFIFVLGQRSPNTYNYVVTALANFLVLWLKTKDIACIYELLSLTALKQLLQMFQSCTCVDLRQLSD